MAKVICMASPKGGSGKTVLTATFAALLSSLRKRVLLVDTDAATNGLTLFYLRQAMLQREIAVSEKRTPRGVYDDVSTNQFELIHLDNDVDVLPATYSFQNTELRPLEQYERSLSDCVATFAKDYDYIFLDAQAGSDQFARIAMRRDISDQVVIVSEYDPLSAAGVERLKALFPEDLNYMRTWVLLNKMLPQFVQSFSDFMEIARYLSPIPWDADVVLAYARRTLAINTETGNDFTLAILQTLRGLLGDEIEMDVRSWLANRAAALRQPIVEQFEDAEKELHAIINQRFAATRSAIVRRTVTVAVIATLAFVPVFFPYMFTVFGERYNRVEEMLIGFAVALSGALAFGFVEKFFTGRSEQVELLRKQEDILLQRLTRLDALRSASVETLVKRDHRDRSGA